MILVHRCFGKNAGITKTIYMRMSEEDFNDVKINEFAFNNTKMF